MIDELIANVSQRTGITPEKARAAVEVVVAQLKTHLPAPIASHIDGLLAGGSANPTDGAGLLGGLESRAKDMLGGMLK